MPLAAGAYYPEREDPPEPFFDRLLADLGFRWHNILARRQPVPATFGPDVARHAAGWATEPASRVPELRYRLRRDGLLESLVAECFGAYCAARARPPSDMPSREVFGAALTLLKGGIAELADASGRREAVELASAVWAISGISVHLMLATEARAQAAARALAEPLAALGLASGVIAQGMDAAARREAYAAAVVCGTPREIAHDYLRDRVMLGGQQRPLARALQRVSGETGGSRQPVMRGLQCALIDDADVLMLDDAVAPITVTSDAERPRERLMYEQALELARALAAGADFALEDDGARLTDAGSQRVERLVGALGGIWAARQRREDLVTLALGALHRLERDSDYRVEQGRIVLANPIDREGAEPTEADQTALRLLEVKEGCKLGAAPDVVARLSLPRFLRRYVRLAGACPDASDVAGELWSLYRLKTTPAGTAAVRGHGPVRAFATAAARRAMLAERAAALSAAGQAVVIAMRTPTEAQALATVLQEAGLDLAPLRGTGDAAERKALEQLSQGSGVALLLYPGERYIAAVNVADGRVSVLIGELHDARRHVQRICRAFSASSCEVLIATEDATVKARIGGVAAAWARRGASEDGELTPRRARWLAGIAQRAAERSSATTREEVMSRDQQMDTLLAFSGRRE